MNYLLTNSLNILGRSLLIPTSAQDIIIYDFSKYLMTNTSLDALPVLILKTQNILDTCIYKNVEYIIYNSFISSSRYLNITSEIETKYLLSNYFNIVVEKYITLFFRDIIVSRDIIIFLEITKQLDNNIFLTTYLLKTFNIASFLSEEDLFEIIKQYTSILNLKDNFINKVINKLKEEDIIKIKKFINEKNTFFTNIDKTTFSKLELGVYFKKNNKNFFINEDYNFDDLFKALINLDIEAFPKNIEEI